MTKYKTILIISIISIVIAASLIIISSSRTPKLEDQRQAKYNRMNENIEDLRFDNVVWPTQNGVDALNDLGIDVDFAEQELSRNSYIELEHSVIILYENERYFIDMDDFTHVVYSSTQFGLVDHYVRYYFTIDGERIDETSFYVNVDPKTEFDYWHSQSDFDDYRDEYYDDNIKILTSELEFYEIGVTVSICLIMLSVPLLIVFSRKLYLYSGFETIELAKEHYKKLYSLKSKKRKKDSIRRTEDKQKERLEKLKNLERDLQEPKDK